MRAKVVIWLLCIAVILAWTEVVGAQAAPAASKVQLPSGETVWDLSGDWNSLVEHYAPFEAYGTHTNVIRITQTGNAFSGIRLRDQLPPLIGRAGGPSVRGELDQNGFKRVEMFAGSGSPVPCRGEISEDGKKIVLDDKWMVKVTLTRPGDSDKIKALLLRPAGWKADWSLPGGYDKGEGEWIFEARGDKVVAKILITSRSNPLPCEKAVTITSDGVMFDGCFDLDITLRFDPNDQDYPFKGKSGRGYDYKVKAK